MGARSPRRRLAGRRGFTLIELLVVMGVIALLMSILVPVLGVVREQVRVHRVEATIQGISTALSMYRDAQGRYPPDEHPQLSKSSQCLVYYLSGGSIFYSADSPIDYPWKHDLYNVASNMPGKGRKNFQRYYDFKSKYLQDYGGHEAPALVDPWSRRLIYNATGTASAYYGRYGGAKHGGKEYDLFSAGPDGRFGTEDDVTNWQDKLGWGYDSFNLNNGTH